MELRHSHTWVKVPASTTQVADGALFEIDEATPPKPNGRGAVDRPKTSESLLTPKSIMTVGCWNVHTLKAEGALEMMLHELDKFNGT